MVGKLQPDFFPHLFGPRKTNPSTPGPCRAFAALAKEIGDGRAPEEVADGAIRVAVENMANAIRSISVQRGYDVTDYLLNCFGGAGGQHACLVADALGLERVLIHPLSGVLSAYGIGLADLRASRTATCHLSIRGGLGAEARRRRWRKTPRPSSWPRACARGRPRGARASPLCRDRQRVADPARRLSATPAGMRAAFEIVHQQRFGFTSPEKEIEIEAIEVEALGGGERPEEPDLPLAPEPPEPQTTTRLFTDGAWHEAPVFLRDGLGPGIASKAPR